MKIIEAVIFYAIGMIFGANVTLADTASPDSSNSSPATTLPTITAPQAIGSHSVARFYPQKALLGDEQGQIEVAYTIGEDGTTTDLSVKKSSGFADLDNAALQAVRTWRYKPATQDGKPVAVHVNVDVRFAIR